jgi:hypothetical protein
MKDKVYFKIRDVFGAEVILTEFAWQDIQFKHPEVRGLEEKVGRTIREPEVVVRSVYDERVVLCYSFFEEILGGKYLVVVVKTIAKGKKYVSTVYITDRRKGGEIVWKAR